MPIIKKEGFLFSFNNDMCKNCSGECCRGESGDIILNNDEVKKIAEYLNINLPKFYCKYAWLRPDGKTRLKEIRYNSEYLCIFFDIFKKKCNIYEVRPKQCRDFPFLKKK